MQKNPFGPVCVKGGSVHYTVSFSVAQSKDFPDINSSRTMYSQTKQQPNLRTSKHAISKSSSYDLGAEITLAVLPSVQYTISQPNNTNSRYAPNQRWQISCLISQPIQSNDYKQKDFNQNKINPRVCVSSKAGLELSTTCMEMLFQNTHSRVSIPIVLAPWTFSIHSKSEHEYWIQKNQWNCPKNTLKNKDLTPSISTIQN